MSLSKRVEHLAKPDPRYRMWDIVQDGWCPKSNARGIVNLGMAENTLMHDVLSEHIRAHMDTLPTSAFTYGDGGRRLKATLGRFLTRRLKARVPVEPAHLTLANGCSSVLEHLSWALADAGDVVLLGRPHYATFVDDVMLRMGAELVTVSFGRDVDPLGIGAVERYEEEVLTARRRGKRVAAMIVSNPHNPLGRCYPREVLVGLLGVCQRYGVHFISDEIYALSTFATSDSTGAEDAAVPFESVLSLPLDDKGKEGGTLIDRSLVHVVWGPSKDFGANGLRLGALISQENPALHAALVPAGLYASVSSLTEHAATAFLGDDAWVDGYVRENAARLADGYERAARWARERGIRYTPGVTAAFFLWVDLGTAYKRARRERRRSNSSHSSGIEDGEEEKEDINAAVTEALLRNKVFLASGVQFGAEESGWFRIVFSHTAEYLEEGLRRIDAAIEGRHQPAQ